VNERQDPRNTITPESFAIDPVLLGRPLARPGRRLAAMAVDLLLIAILVNAGGLLFGVAAAWVFLRVSGRSSGGGVLRRSWRLAFRSAAALTLFVVVFSAWGRLTGEDGARGVEAGALTFSGADAVGVAADLYSVRQSSSAEELERSAERLVRRMSAAGASSGEIRELVTALASRDDRPWSDEVTARVLAAYAAGASERSPAAEPAADSLVLEYASALREPEAADLNSLRLRVAASVAADTIGVLAAEVASLERSRAALIEELRVARERRSLLDFLRTLAEDLGLGFGWSGLYFTAFLVLWRGQTPGKRLMKVRVVRLDGKPMTWWSSFERFGGYAASIFTALLGFAQVVWDRNRQGMHDKIVETVVVREET
jgi:hypothetical protein